MNRVVKARLHYRVLVTLKDGSTFGGVLWEADARESGSLVLRDAEAFPTSTQAQTVPVDGELLIPWANVQFIQKP